MYQVASGLGPAVAGVTYVSTTSLAVTGFAFGLYLALALLLIVAGLIVRHMALAKAR